MENMGKDKYYHEFDEFIEQHPEIPPELRQLAEPVVQGIENQLYSFIVSYIFM
ncbi:MAG: hypothetical protein LBT08_04205 [Synergistaceae bacterium]|jgi:hypothetical protein|nr:hypothetical protein [Synergistaceae bacterium]